MKNKKLWIFFTLIIALGIFVSKSFLGWSGETSESDNSNKAAPKFENFDPKNFDEKSTNVNNKWMPLVPGTLFVYKGTTVEDDGKIVPHRIEVNVTDLTKEIGGVRSVITWDLDYSDNKLVEAELAFYAQDKDGNVWRMGEYPEEYSDGEFDKASPWMHGIKGARAGIMMQATPKVGTPSYSQGWGPEVDWTDRGQVDKMDEKFCVPVACYQNVLVIAETSASEPDAVQLKYYAPDVGNVKVGWRGKGEKSKEILELDKQEMRSQDSLESVREEALKLENHAYEVSRDVYGLTKKAK